MNYGDKIRTVREKLKITQKEMAKSLEISQSYLSAIESGKMQVNAKVIFGLSARISSYLRASANGSAMSTSTDPRTGCGSSIISTRRACAR